MANLQVKDYPEDKYQQLKALAASSGRSLRDIIVASLERELQWAEFASRLARAPRTELTISAARALVQEREESGRAE